MAAVTPTVKTLMTGRRTAAVLGRQDDFFESWLDIWNWDMFVRSCVVRMLDEKDRVMYKSSKVD